MGRKLVFEFEEEEIARLTEQQREVLTELWRSRNPERPAPMLPSERLRATAKPGPTKKEVEQKVAEQYREDGTYKVRTTVFPRSRTP